MIRLLTMRGDKGMSTWRMPVRRHRRGRREASTQATARRSHKINSPLQFRPRINHDYEQNFKGSKIISNSAILRKYLTCNRAGEILITLLSGNDVIINNKMRIDLN